ncbi:uncharacterized protein LOC127783165 [Oryza glaberrima]|nr:uncharacterized protein LOC127783165 [Oryza glaberrima]
MSNGTPAKIKHKFHQHELKLVTAAADDKERFKCDGCNGSIGAACARYTCNSCDFDLHTSCALAPLVLPEHRLFDGCKFRLLREPPPPGPGNRRVCDACGGDVTGRGFVYHCSDRDLDIHPCCATLPESVALDGAEFVLCDGGGRNVPRQCAFCKRDDGGCSCSRTLRRKVWTYRSCYDGEAMYLHVACVKEMVQEILAAGHGGGGGDGGGRSIISVSILEKTMKKRKRSRTGKAVKCFLNFAISVIVSVLFGDPTGLAVPLVGAFISNVVYG